MLAKGRLGGIGEGCLSQGDTGSWKGSLKRLASLKRAGKKQGPASLEDIEGRWQQTSVRELDTLCNNWKCALLWRQAAPPGICPLECHFITIDQGPQKKLHCAQHENSILFFKFFFFLKYIYIF